MKKLFLWGAGGHGRVVLDIARAMGGFGPIAFLDDGAPRDGGEFCGCAVFAGLEEVERRHASGSAGLAIAIGSNRARARCAAVALERGWELETLVHPSAVVSPSARLGAGTVVMPRAVINAGAVVGRNCIVNSGAIVEHDCRIGDHVHLSPGAILGGGVTLEDAVHMGLGSMALPGTTIGADAVVGAGALVLRGVSRGETVVGVPARSIKSPVAIRRAS